MRYYLRHKAYFAALRSAPYAAALPGMSHQQRLARKYRVCTKASAQHFHRRRNKYFWLPLSFLFTRFKFFARHFCSHAGEFRALAHLLHAARHLLILPSFYVLVVLNRFFVSRIFSIFCRFLTGLSVSCSFLHAGFCLKPQQHPSPFAFWACQAQYWSFSANIYAVPSDHRSTAAAPIAIIQSYRTAVYVHFKSHVFVFKFASRFVFSYFEYCYTKKNRDRRHRQ